MGFLDFFRGAQVREASSTQQQETSNTGTYENKMVRVTSPQKSLTVSAVYRAVELKAKTIGSMEMQYQRRNREGGNFVSNMYGDGRMLNWLLQKQANPLMTGSELFQQMSIHRELLGKPGHLLESFLFYDHTCSCNRRQILHDCSFVHIAAAAPWKVDEHRTCNATDSDHNTGMLDLVIRIIKPAAYNTYITSLAHTEHLAEPVRRN